MKIEVWTPPAAGRKFASAADKHDAIAGEYEAQYHTGYWKIYDALTWDHMSTAVLGRLRAGRLLDAGGGTGRWARAFARLGFRVDVVDPAGRMRELGAQYAAAEGLSDNITFHDGDVCCLPFDEAEFDGVICQGNPVNYCSDPARAILELSRVARPGAPVVISVHNKIAMIQYYCFVTGKITLDEARRFAATGEVELDYPIRALTPEELLADCGRAGLQVDSMVGKPSVSGHVQTPAYLAMLETTESFEQVVALEKTFWREPSILGMAGHIEVACTRVARPQAPRHRA